MSSLYEILQSTGIGDLFRAGSDLANIGLLGLFGTSTVGLSWFAFKAYQREVKRGDLAMAGWQAATEQFERALDLIEKMSNRRRSEDAR